MNRILVLFLSFISITSAYAQDHVLETYIQTALESNLALQQKEYSYYKSLEALNEAKRMFLPTVSFEARYSVAEGGRTVTIPFGDMLNPVYNNLNVINQGLDIPAPDYAEIENTELSFIRSPEQETKFVATMPVFNASIIQNHKIKEGMVEVEKISVDIYRRELVKEVKDAYVKYLQMEQTYLLYKNTLKTVNQNLKNRQSLYKHNKITIDEVYAAKAQVKQIEKDLSEVNKNRFSEYVFNNEGDFVTAGINLKWNLFTSGQRQSKINQAKIDRNITESRKQEVERQVQLEVIEAYYSIQTAMQGIELAKEELQNYQKSYNLVEKKYQQGMVNYLEYSNSLNNKLDAENKLILAQYSYQLEQIKIERLTSSYKF